MFTTTSNLRFPLRIALTLVTLGFVGITAHSAPPPHLPRYYLDIQLDTQEHTALVRQRVIWTNCRPRPATELIFNAHSHYQLPDKDVGMTAKIFEILRMMPSEALDFDGHALDVRKVHLVRREYNETIEELGQPRKVAFQPEGEVELPSPRVVEMKGDSLSFHYQEKNDSALVVPLPQAV